MFADRVLKVENVGPGKTALITIPLGPTYDKFVLLLGGALVAADLAEIRVMANGREVFKDTGPNLNSRQVYMGVSTNVGEVTIDLTEPKSRGGAAQQYAASIPSNLLKQLVIEVDIGAGANAGSTLACFAEFRGATQNPFILKRKRFVQAFAAAGDFDLFMPNGVAGGVIKRVWLHDGGNVSAAILKVGGYVALRYKTIAELTRQAIRNGLVPQANIDCLDFVQDGNLQGALNTTANAQVALTLTLGAAQVVTGFVDYIDPIDRI